MLSGNDVEHLQERKHRHQIRRMDVLPSRQDAVGAAERHVMPEQELHAGLHVVERQLRHGNGGDVVPDLLELLVHADAIPLHLAVCRPRNTRVPGGSFNGETNTFC